MVTTINADEQKIVTIQNKTKTTLHIKNKRQPSFGPEKGKWCTYKEFKLAPGKQENTDFFKTDKHLLSVHSATSRGPDTFFYEIRAFDLEDGNTIILHDNHYQIL